ncbi:MAG: hypothetical protein CMP00_05920 [Woeseiaceae bacterium]|jgi:hypothetical protein|nr:hypothetical protein [Woeseiaceae bacterium]|tara:strand:+ start:6927 stop:7913 length:987 start_codon:yes stop_codon:yes gene_type:complete
MRKKRNIEAFSLSFLDCICCGFGAVVLLLVLSKLNDPNLMMTDKVSEDSIILLTKEIEEIKDLSVLTTNEIELIQSDTSKKQLDLNLLNQELNDTQSLYDKSLLQPELLDADEGELEAARQKISDEIKRLQPDFKRAANEAIGGIPVDSEYIIFVIDTSGSMQSKWDWAERKLGEVLDVYPTVKGLQIMNDNGRFMFQQYGRTWLPDTPQLRQSIKNTMRQWAPFSDSDPSDGIIYAIQSFWAPEKKISIYVFGDEFQGNSMEKVLRDIDEINVEDKNGDRLVRIHAVGFPYSFGGRSIPQSSQRFAGLMRLLCERNGGTFVALTNAN